MKRHHLQKGRPLYRSVFPLIVCMALIPLALQAGCSKEADSSKVGGNASETAGAPTGPPPIPDNLSPEIKARIAKEQAEFQARSQQSRQRAQEPPSGDVTKNNTFLIAIVYCGTRGSTYSIESR